MLTARSASSYPSTTGLGLTYTDARARAVARQNLEEAQARLATHGLVTTGEVGEASPVEAVGTVLEREGSQAFDALIVSTWRSSPPRTSWRRHVIRDRLLLRRGSVVSPSSAGLRLWRLLARTRRAVLSPIQQDGADAMSLVQALEASPRFRRDGPMGRIFHPGKISYRELSPTNSLHVLVGGGGVSAHVDDVCPLRCADDGSAHYSWTPVIRHNAAGMVADLGRRLRGLHGQERCNLVCESVWVDDDGIADLVAAAGSSPSEPSPSEGTRCDEHQP